MSVKELIKKLQGLDPLLEVHVNVSKDFDYTHPLVHDLEVKRIGFAEEVGGPVLASDVVVVLELM